MPNHAYSADRRLKFAAKLAKLIDPDGGPSTLDAVNRAVEGLADMPDEAFSPLMPAFIAPRCTAMPTADELRELLTDARQRIGGTAQAARAANDDRVSEKYPPGAGAPLERWLVDRIMAECGGKPGPMLRKWLQFHGEP